MNSPPDPLDPLPVYTLLRHDDVNQALQCLVSLYRHARDPIRHTILDDGTLTAEDRDRLLQAFPAATILTRPEADDLVLPALRDKPNCRNFRVEHPFALKLIDPFVHSAGAFALCDSDVIFLRPFSALDRRSSDAGEDIVYMRDRTTAYSMDFRKRHWGRDRLRIPEYVNAGILYVGPKAFDLDFIEWIVGREDYRKYMWVMEQTVWAAIGGRVRPFYFDPLQVAFPKPGMTFGEDWVALHFISPLRHRLHDRPYLAELSRRYEPKDGQVAALRTRPAIFLDPLRDIIGRVGRRIRPPR